MASKKTSAFATARVNLGNNRNLAPNLIDREIIGHDTHYQTPDLSSFLDRTIPFDKKR